MWKLQSSVRHFSQDPWFSSLQVNFNFSLPTTFYFKLWLFLMKYYQVIFYSDWVLNILFEYFNLFSLTATAAAFMFQNRFKIILPNQVSVLFDLSFFANLYQILCLTNEFLNLFDHSFIVILLINNSLLSFLISQLFSPYCCSWWLNQTKIWSKYAI